MNLYENYMKHYNAIETINKKVALMVGKSGLEAEVAKILRSAQRYERHATKIEKFVISLALSHTDIDTRRAMQDIYKNNPSVRRRTVVRLMESEQLKPLFQSMEYNVRG